jgi:hypothetical protein
VQIMTGHKALVGALVLVALTLPATADARRGTDAGSGPRVQYALDMQIPRRICLNSNGIVSVAVVRGVSAVNTNTTERVGAGLMRNMPDVIIDATVADNSIVSLTDATRVTWLDGDRDPPTANFRFRANKVGTTSLSFRARISEMGDFPDWRGPLEDVADDIGITVINCKFEISTHSRFAVDGEANLRFGAGFNRVALEPSADGEYQASASLGWYASVSQVGDCLGRGAPNRSNVVIRGRLDDSGTLTVEIEYRPFGFTLTGNCGGLSANVSPTALRVEVPPGGGGVIILDHTLTSPFGDAPGQAAVLVRPTDVPTSP